MDPLEHDTFSPGIPSQTSYLSAHESRKPFPAFRILPAAEFPKFGLLFLTKFFSGIKKQHIPKPKVDTGC